MNMRPVFIMLYLVLIIALVNGCNNPSSSSRTTLNASTGSSGKSGSMARFTIDGYYMYALSKNKLHVFNLEVASRPTLINEQPIGWEAETIFCYKDLLFFGTRSGMIIYDISDPENPRHLSQYRHIYSRDPVVVSDDIAYVTLRSGGRRGMGANELQVFDIKDPMKPKQLKTYPMKNPWGLGISDKTLFVCDGRAGLKIYDATNPEKLELVKTMENINGYDVIPNGGILIVSARDGIYQFDYSTKKMNKLSHIPVGY